MPNNKCLQECNTSVKEGNSIEN